MRYRLVAFDMDGTLILEESCWKIIHQKFGTVRAARKNLLAYDSGIINYEEFMRRDIALWQPAPTIDEIGKILSRYTFAPNVREVVREIVRRGFQTAIITGGLDILANNVARELGIPHVVANGLKIDGTGRLTGEGILRVEPRRKDRNLIQLARNLGISTEECVAVGDGTYDVNFLKKAGLAIAVGNNPDLVRVADVIISDFSHFSRLLDYLG